MPTSTDYSRHELEVGRGHRGPRYYIFLLLLLTWGIFFLLTSSAVLTRLSFLGFLAAGVLLYLGLVLRNVYRSLNPVRTPILQNPSSQHDIDFEDVVFPSRDGWMLSSWFVSPQNGATVILTHGMGGNRLDLMPVASVFAERGFGLLMYDMRARSLNREFGHLGLAGSK